MSTHSNTCDVAAPRNRLRGQVSYLAGPIDRCPNGGTAWRDWIKPRLRSLGVTPSDPLDKPYLTGLEDDDARARRLAYLEEGRYDEFAAIMKAVRLADLRMVDESHFVIVNLDLDTPMCGTWEELYWANRIKRPVLIWCPQGKKRVPHWLFGTIPHRFFFDSLDDLLLYLCEVDAADEVETYGRWLFLDPAKLASAA